MPDDYDLGADLEASGVTADELARLTGVNRTTVWRWLNGTVETPVYARTILRQARRIRALTKTPKRKI